MSLHCVNARTAQRLLIWGAFQSVWSNQVYIQLYNESPVLIVSCSVWTNYGFHANTQSWNSTKRVQPGGYNHVGFAFRMKIRGKLVETGVRSTTSCYRRKSSLQMLNNLEISSHYWPAFLAFQWWILLSENLPNFIVLKRHWSDGNFLHSIESRERGDIFIINLRFRLA